MDVVRAAVERLDDGQLAAVRQEIDLFEQGVLPREAQLRSVASECGEVNVGTVNVVVSEVWRRLALRLEGAA